MSMNHLLPQLQPFKDKIPQFIMKLYHILQKKEHEEHLTWFGDQQIVIKQPKKFQQKVLPKYFRHKHLSSFIRQLNMYKFNKVPKLIKQKNHMYFKNEFFQRGQIQLLLKLKRNTKKNRGSDQTMVTHQRIDEVSNSQNVSINEKLHENDKSLQDNDKLNEYKSYVKNSASQIHSIIAKLTSNPLLQSELKPIFYLCEELMESKRESLQSLGISSSHKSYDQLSFLGPSQIALPKIQGGIGFPSQFSLCNFNSLNRF